MIKESTFTKEELAAGEYESSDLMVCGVCKEWASVYRAVEVNPDTGEARRGEVLGSSCCNAPERIGR